MIDKEIIEQWLRDLEDENQANRFQRIRDLGTYWRKSEKIIPALTKALESEKDLQNRKAILQVFVKIGSEPKLPRDLLFDIMITDNDKGIKFLISVILLRNIDQEFLPKLTKQLRKKTIDNDTLEFIIDLITVLEEGAIELADRIFSFVDSNRSERIKIKTINAIGKIACKKYSDKLFKIISNNYSINIRNAAIIALRNLDNPKRNEIEALMGFLRKDEKRTIIKALFSTLSVIGKNYKELIIPEFINFAKKHDDENIRRNAILSGNRLDNENFPLIIIEEFDRETNAKIKSNIYSSLDVLKNELKCKSSEEIINVYRRKTIPIKRSSISDVNNKMVFIIMSFKPDLNSTFDCVKEIAKEFGLEAKRVDLELGDFKITDKIIQMIEESRFVIADLTHDRPNVYFELGYARGIDKTVITTVKGETKVHFDVKDWKYLKYDDTRELEEPLRKEIQHILNY